MTSQTRRSRNPKPHLSGDAPSRDKTPLEVMLKNVEFFKQESDALAATLELLLAEEDGQNKQLADTLMKAMIDARKNMKRCAVQAAPYVHPKFKPARSKPSMRKQ